MIIVKKEGKQITISGHALYAPIGADIVCAGVSALVQCFAASIEELGAIKSIKDSKEKMIIEIKSDTAETRLLIRSFFIGLSLIEQEYPKYIKCLGVERH